MGQVDKDRLYSKQLSDNYILKHKLDNKRAREKALKALNDKHNLYVKKADS
ncbi:hypothetical protein [Salipaludibacillus daqingensis]|uniref:hypothetical protein n=1 Tax=Salipaludibacillus daqingensis TaxID=3041001 RepID=UPI00247619CB|nr:hypothetical protein [Salipaludibacillus daqingensis]